MRIAVAVGWMIVAGIGCGGGSGVGNRCATRTDCPSAMECVSQAQGGYCTQACTVAGQQSGCPSDSICDRIFTQQLMCVKRCQNQSDCRADTECNGLTGTNVKACKPKP